MRWKINKIKYNKDDTKIETTFLLFPMTINGETRWLEKASYKLKICRIYTIGNSQKLHYDWTPVSWI